MAVIGRLLLILYNTLSHNVKTSPLTFVIVSGIFLQRSAQAQISAFPTNTEAGIGQTVTMYCRIINAVANNIEWHHTPYGLQKLSAVYLDGFIYANYRDRFTVTGDPLKGECNLKIDSVRLEDAGKYICMHKTDSYSAELIVFATFPSSQSCTVTIPKNGFLGSNVCKLEPDVINMSCNLSYCGNKIPAVEWKNASGSILPSVLTSRADVNTSTLIHKALKDDTFTCYIRYLLSDIQSKFSWAVSIDVHNISHNETVQNIGCDSRPINCATPRLPYNCVTVWNSSNGSFISYTVLYTKDLPNGLYKCSAQCSVRGTTCTSQQLAVVLNCVQSSTDTEPQSNPTESGASIALVIPVVVVIVVVIALIAVAVVFIRKRKIKFGNTSTLEDNQQLEATENPKGHKDDSLLSNLECETGHTRDGVEDDIKPTLLESQDERGYVVC